MAKKKDNPMEKAFKHFQEEAEHKGNPVGEGWFKPSEFASLIGKSNSTATRTLARQHKEGLLERYRYGIQSWYRDVTK